ncbi:MAG TPA: hypothetical protein VLV50_19720 [Stellaceae bacterium]|nr:hypothetical protein [Stellaceae bacterium]
MRRAAAAILFLAGLGPAPALAFRPFDGTDASVADTGQMEVELGPVGYLRQGAEHSLVAPALELNYGVAPRWETGIDGNANHGLAPSGTGSTLVGNTLHLKGVLREGVLQQQAGPSVATELNLLLPGIGDENGVGGSVAGIISQEWRSLTFHVNAVASVTREQHGDLFLGTIIEGPRQWPVRPVAEIFGERDFGGVDTRSLLIGAIWQVRDTLAFDAGLRGARVGGNTVGEVRAGFTFAFPL